MTPEPKDLSQYDIYYPVDSLGNPKANSVKIVCIEHEEARLHEPAKTWWALPGMRVVGTKKIAQEIAQKTYESLNKQKRVFVRRIKPETVLIGSEYLPIAVGLGDGCVCQTPFWVSDISNGAANSGKPLLESVDYFE